MNEREQRGLVIAAKNRIRQKSGVWLVPSQTGNGQKYYVKPEVKTCTCPDHQEAGQHCKHLYAVQFTIEREYGNDGSFTETMTLTTVRKTYPQDWRAYNAAQTSEKATFQILLRDLCDGLSEPQPNIGRPRLPLDDAIFSAVFKVYSTVSGRRFISDLREANEKGHIRKVPHFNSVFNVFDAPGTSSVLTSLILESSRPLKTLESNFACDSSGFSGCRFDRWFDEKWGEARSKKSWVKVHVMTGVKTNVITAVEIHDQHTGDSPLLPSLLNTTQANFDVNEVSADMGYLSETNFQAVIDAGAKPFIPFKSNCSDTRGGLWAKMFHYFHLQRDEFLKHYHQRSNVETTFSMIKAKFGDSVRSKTNLAMKNEVLAKCLCHNICCLIQSMHEFGVNLNFQAA